MVCRHCGGDNAKSYQAGDCLVCSHTWAESPSIVCCIATSAACSRTGTGGPPRSAPRPATAMRARGASRLKRTASTWTRSGIPRPSFSRPRFSRLPQTFGTRCRPSVLCADRPTPTARTPDNMCHRPAGRCEAVSRFRNDHCQGFARSPFRPLAWSRAIGVPSPHDNAGPRS